MVEDKAVCTDSKKISSTVGKKINLKGKLTEQNADAVSLSRFQSSELIIELDLSDNPHLTSLPKFVMDLPNLTHLNISNTKISDWDRDICQLKKLENLIGRNNSYKDNEVPFYTFCLESLRVLDMSNSRIKYIDEYIGKLSNLEELRMAHNQLIIIPLMLSTLPRLVIVDFRENTLKNEDLNILQSCKRVPKDDQQGCQKDLAEAIECEFIHELPFQRKKPLRQVYTDLVAGSEDISKQCDSDYDSCPHFVKSCVDILDEDDRSQCQLNAFESARQDHPNDLLHRSDCYIAWVGWMVDYENSSQFLENTIRGKTIRELRYSSEYQSSRNPFFCHNPIEHLKLAFWKPERLEPFPFEVYPEQMREKGIASHIQAFFSEGDPQYWGIPISKCIHLPTLKNHVDAIINKNQIQYEIKSKGLHDDE